MFVWSTKGREECWRGEGSVGGDDGCAGFILEGSGDESKGVDRWSGIIKNGGKGLVVVGCLGGPGG